jgi:hypothetical protein
VPSRSAPAAGGSGAGLDEGAEQLTEPTETRRRLGPDNAVSGDSAGKAIPPHTSSLNTSIAMDRIARQFAGDAVVARAPSGNRNQQVPASR